VIFVILALAGQIASGKTKLSSELAQRLSWKRGSFGDYLRHIASVYGLPDSREHLQKLGDEIIQSSWSEFCQKVLNHSTWQSGENLVIDGIRHVEALENLKTICSPQLVHLIFINTANELRYARLQQRAAPELHELARYEQHSSETQSHVLKARADLVLDGSKSTEDLVFDLLDWIEKESK
jgi:dephospho-CoA kinase